MNKNIFSLPIAILCIVIGSVVFTAKAQSPQKMSYQVVIRNSNDSLVINKKVAVRITILKDLINSKSVYSEMFTPTTNENGLITIEIGGAKGMDTINWASGAYYIQTETDTKGGANYSITSTTQLLSVPYALYAQSAGSNFDGNYNLISNKPTTIGDFQMDAKNQNITNLGNPINDNDIVPKSFVQLSLSEYGDTLYLGKEQKVILPIAPVLSTLPIDLVEQYSARSGGSVSRTGGLNIIEKGICWGTSPNPTIENEKTTNGTGTGNFTATANNLKPNTTYYLRAYATNNLGTSYGQELVFTTQTETSTLLCDAIDACTQTVTTGGDGVWITQSAFTSDGIDAAQSNIIGDQQKTWMELTIDGPGKISFLWKVSSEKTFDKLSFYINNELKASISGEEDWHLYESYIDKGKNVLRWEYSKDPSDADGSDCGWVDAFKFTATEEISLCEAIDNCDLIFSNGDDAGWYGQQAKTHDNMDAIKSNPIGDDQFCTLSTTVEGPGVLTFWWSVSSDPSDFLEFYIDNVLKDKISGNKTWANKSYTISSGSHTLTWKYIKDGGTNSLSDCGYIDQIGYQKVDENSVPQVSTISIASISKNTAACDAKITSDGGLNIIASGVCWSTSPNPTLANSKSTDGSQLGSYKSTITPLLPNTTYYVRAYATNQYTTAYGEEISFNTNICDAFDNCDLAFTTSGEALWYKQTEISFDGSDALRSGTLNDAQSCTLATTITGPATVQFMCKSNTNKAGLLFICDSKLQARIEGVFDWKKKAYYVGEGEHKIEWHFATNLTGSSTSDCVWIDNLTITPREPLTHCNAIDNCEYELITGKSPSWFSQVNESHDGEDAMQSGYSETGFESSMQTTVEGPCQLKFWWKASGVKDYDNLTLYIDNAYTSRISGITDWEEKTIIIKDGTHTIKWVYWPSSGLKGGEKCGWVDEVRYIRTGANIPLVSTSPISSLTENSAISGGNILSDWDIPILAKGVCWSNTPNPTIANSHTRNGTGTESFSSTITPTLADSTYYVRAYATNMYGTGYGEEIVFDTKLCSALNNCDLSFTTDNVKWFKQNSESADGVSSARSGGSISRLETKIKGPGIVKFWWKVSSELNSDYLNFKLDGRIIDKISGETDWMQKEMFINEKEHRFEWIYVESGSTKAGLNCGFLDSITITPVFVPAITTAKATSINECYALAAASIELDEQYPLLKKGLCWSTVQNPTITNFTTNNTSEGGTFTDTIVNLNPQQTYYVRAYATNISGTYYGNEISFTTSNGYPICEVVNNCGLSFTTGGNANWFGQKAFSFDGDGAAKSATIANAQETWMETSIPGPSVIRFQMKISSEPLNDKLSYYINGLYVENVSGEIDWTAKEFDLPKATNTFRWVYNKNDNILNGDDCVWIDQVEYHMKTLASVSTDHVSEIACKTAVATASVTNNGFSTVTSRGICWGTSPNPTITGNKIASGAGSGSFVATLTGLQHNTLYYVRAYATNAMGTVYGNELSFKTNEAFVPTLSTVEITDIDFHTATSGGIVESSSGLDISAKGLCWSTEHAPTISNFKTNNGNGNAAYSGKLTNLLPNTTYYVRAYATNEIGTGYGNEVEFSTLPTIPICNALDNCDSPFTTGGNRDWFGQTVTSYNGIDAAQSGLLSTNQQSWLETQIEGPRELSFKWKVNSTSSNDKMVFYLNNVEQKTISKTTDWAEVSIYLPAGNNTLKWVYKTDTFYSPQASLSCGWIDQFKLSASTKKLPVVTTMPVTTIFQTLATSGGSVSNDGGASILARGVCWSISSNPTIENEKTTDGTGTGNFTATASNLKPNTTYYIRAYATNVVGTTYGEEFIFKTLEATLPIVYTNSVLDISQTTANIGCKVLETGNIVITERGVCWSTTNNPAIDGTKIKNTKGGETYNCYLMALHPSTTYYACAYATNELGTTYGDVLSFTTEEAILVTDIDGNVYPTVTIGSQVWMAENLKVTKYRNGNTIGTTPAYDTNISNYSQPKYQWAYRSDESNVETYGRLYTWYAATDSREVCPVGWHLPSIIEWRTLAYFLVDNVGGKLKETGTEHWYSPNNSATNETGFNALPAGYRYEYTFAFKGWIAFWWTNSHNGSDEAYQISIDGNYGIMFSDLYSKKYGYSIRCVKDK